MTESSIYMSQLQEDEEGSMSEFDEDQSVGENKIGDSPEG